MCIAKSPRWTKPRPHQGEVIFTQMSQMIGIYLVPRTELPMSLRSKSMAAAFSYASIYHVIIRMPNPPPHRGVK